MPARPPVPTSIIASGASAAPRPDDALRLFPYERYEPEVEELGESYRRNAPVPHVVFDQFLDRELARAMAAEFPNDSTDRWINYRHVNENKASLNRWEEMPPTIAAVLHELTSPRFVAWCSRITGIADLIADPELDGGGMNLTRPGGFLNVHTDFSIHRHRPSWRRRCNLILYLNEDWNPDWGGAMEVWAPDMSRCVESIPCEINRAVLFDTAQAFHGFPDPLRCPADRRRKSLQIYYYTADALPDVDPVPTTYYARPQDPALRRILVSLDNRALGTYDALKRRLGFSDDLISRIMASFSRMRR